MCIRDSTRTALETHAAARTLFVDTVADTPQTIALKILEFLRTD